jgi:hypothetical protein
MTLGILGDFEILTMFAAEIAAHRGNRIGKRTGQQMKKGLLFNGVDVFADQSTVVEAVENPSSIFPNLADSPVAVVDQAIMTAKVTANMPRGVSGLRVKERFMHDSPFRAMAFVCRISAVIKGFYCINSQTHMAGQ